MLHLQDTYRLDLLNLIQLLWFKNWKCEQMHTYILTDKQLEQRILNSAWYWKRNERQLSCNSSRELVSYVKNT